MTLNCFHVFGDLGIVIGQHSPLTVLASARVHSWEVFFVTYAELKRTLHAGDEGALLHPRVALRTLALPCFLKLDDKTSSLLDVFDGGGRHHAEWLQAVEQSCGADVLLCNLFAMPPVYHLSERLGIPWVCCSPCLVPCLLVSRHRSCPRSRIWPWCCEQGTRDWDLEQLASRGRT